MILGKKFDPAQDDVYKGMVDIESRVKVVEKRIAEVATEVCY